MLSGKPGCMTLHMGDEADDLAYVMKAVKNTGLTCTMFHPTHVTRNEQLFQKSPAAFIYGWYHRYNL